LRRTSPNSLSFCKLQSTFAENFFAEHNYPRPDLTTAYLFNRGKLFQKSSAILQAIALTNSPVKYLTMFHVIPNSVRDGIYNFIASLRQYIKIGKTSCRKLTPGERKRFIEI
jgi:predicted DCC family thiol-disulfide oxidoreductase YuxK